MSLRKKKKATGVELINEVEGRFLSMIEELEGGVGNCAQERELIRIRIKDLKFRDIELEASTKRANTIATNLRSLMGV